MHLPVIFKLFLLLKLPFSEFMYKNGKGKLMAVSTDWSPCIYSILLTLANKIDQE